MTQLCNCVEMRNRFIRFATNIFCYNQIVTETVKHPKKRKVDEKPRKYK